MDSPYTLYEGDCLSVMPDLPAGSVDLVLTDLPYGVTDCEWDQALDLALLWEQLRRVGKRNAAYLFTATLPFAADLIQSNRKWFRYDLVWDKVNRRTGYGNCNKMPLRRHELILVFYPALPTYNPQMGKGDRYFAQRPTGKAGVYQNGGLDPIDTDNDGSRYPNSILAFEGDLKSEMGLHPTQKPVALLIDLILQYSNPGDTVLDCCMGSGSAGVACLETGRKFIGIEKDPAIFRGAKNRITNPGAFVGRRPVAVSENQLALLGGL